jgi:indolepyruvate ferredoxin oxidoreductase, alpha subunit
MLPMAGEYTSEVLLGGVAKFLKAHLPRLSNLGDGGYAAEVDALRKTAMTAMGGPVPPRPPTFCTGCPERPFFSALKLAERDVGKVHVSADIGCHAFGTFAPFNFGNSILGYGMSLASSAGVQSFSKQRPIAIMGDGGFWHNGLLSGVTSRLLNKSDGVLVIMKNGYTSATGTQEIVSSPEEEAKQIAKASSATGSELTIESTLKGLGVGWMKTVHTYKVTEMKAVLKEAITSPFKGLKVIIAEGECQLERQRRIRPLRAAALAAGKRVVRTRYGIDDETCTGDHSCIRLSGCPTLTVKPSKDPLKTDPVAHVTNGCVGCGLCGEVAHAATLCPSFYRADIIANPSLWDRGLARVRGWVTGVR